MEKINFVNNSAPYINATNLNQMQTNIENEFSKLEGKTYSNVDLNDFVETGVYYLWTGLTNAPVNGYIYLSVMGTGGQDLVQVGIPMTGNEIYTRRRIAAQGETSWTNWVATVESGSNARGYYTKYSDGTMIQWNNMLVDDQAINTQYGNSDLYIGTRSITFPVAFVGSNPTCNCGAFLWGTSASWGSCRETSLTTAMLYGYDFFSRASGTNCYIAWIAIGKWK